MHTGDVLPEAFRKGVAKDADAELVSQAKQGLSERQGINEGFDGTTKEQPDLNSNGYKWLGRQCELFPTLPVTTKECLKYMIDISSYPGKRNSFKEKTVGYPSLDRITITPQLTIEQVSSRRGSKFIWFCLVMAVSLVSNLSSVSFLNTLLLGNAVAQQTSYHKFT
ncbi:hypothetical protein GYMLUDRAFT_64771 [Collybiopsis luxurians FD-317 M1]|uniref:Uncharacterized protein n=1 Tax=Collybiopsis luxurians FD-317 M1 TaxID=944289 RepID=A0A0D0C9U6_9AGAR|nr:hypothetical protein GYMLUDRAFT_64771 [Collybiopsis luxurians FD-317 M1]